MIPGSLSSPSAWRWRSAARCAGECRRPACGQLRARQGRNGAATDADFLAAKAAFDRQDAGRLAALIPRLAGHLLEPYVDYWSLNLRLAAAVPVPHADFRRYAERWPDAPLVDRLRVDWLKAAGKRADWSAFALEYPPAAGEDTELACYGIQYRRQRDGDAALARSEAALLHRQGDAGCLRAAVRGADREG